MMKRLMFLPLRMVDLGFPEDRGIVHKYLSFRGGCLDKRKD